MVQQANDWDAARSIMYQEIDARGVQGAVGWAAIILAGSGLPTLPEFMQVIEENGVNGVDEYGMFGWYLVAREAAAIGDTSGAFDALRKSLAYWTNPPFSYTKFWEDELYWGDLRHHPQFKQVLTSAVNALGRFTGSCTTFQAGSIFNRPHRLWRIQRVAETCEV
jgi:hypothetical protein